MELDIDKIDPEPSQDLAAIASAIENHFGTDAQQAHGFDPVARGCRMVSLLENWLLDEEQKGALLRHRWSIFYLRAAAYLLDIGFTGNGDLMMEPGETANRIINGPMGISSSHRILEKWQELGIASRDQAEIIADICQIESNGPRRIQSDPDGNFVDTELLSACIGLSGGLDLTAASILLAVWKLLPTVRSMTPADLSYHFDLVRTGPHPHLTGTIRLQIRCRHPEVHRALKHHERAMHTLLEAINRRVSPRFLFSDILYEIEPVGYEPLDLKFTVDSSAALHLFMGNRLYSDKRVFLRELVQNAADACRLRKLDDDHYEPEISISFNKDISTITVRDNGIGMSRQWIEKYFLAIGISFYRSGEIRSIQQNSRLDVGFISQFGIGFLSSFIVAERIVIKTRRTGGEGLIITITDLKDYFDVRPLKEGTRDGTEVILHLKKPKGDYSRSMEYPGYLRTHIRYLGIPVNLHHENGAVSLLGNENMAYTEEETTGFDFVSRLQFDESEGYLLLSAKCHSDDTIYALESVIGGVSVFQDGIFVTQVETLLTEGARGLVAGRLNLLGNERCELSMDRNRIFWSKDQQQQIKMAILHGLVDLANQLMTMVQGQDLSVNTRNSILNHVSVFFEFSDLDDTLYQKLCPQIRGVVEKRFRNFLRINFAHALRRTGISGAEEYAEAWQQEIIASFVRK